MVEGASHSVGCLQGRSRKAMRCSIGCYLPMPWEKAAVFVAHKSVVGEGKYTRRTDENGSDSTLVRANEYLVSGGGQTSVNQCTDCRNATRIF